MSRQLKDYTDYSKYFSESNLANKLIGTARKAGAKVIYGVLLLTYVLKNPDVPSSDKAKIYGALGYFILPVDLIPDFIPIAGYTDDFAAITWALFYVAKNITPEIKQKAKDKLRQWFSQIDEKELDDMIK